MKEFRDDIFLDLFKSSLPASVQGWFNIRFVHARESHPVGQWLC